MLSLVKQAAIIVSVLVCIGFTAVSCAGEGTGSVIKNIAYKSGKRLSGYERERCVLDLYLPESKKDCPVVVWFHGGGLEGGSKDDAAEIGKFFAKNGVAAAVASYRLFPKAKYPAYVDDAAASVAWTIEHIGEYGIDPDCPVFISGHSAGGYLAAIVGMNSKYLRKYGVDLKRIAGVIPVSGQVFTHFTIRKERKIPNPQNTPTIDDAAPCYYVRKTVPPMLAICGDNDWPARAEENKYFIAMLKTVGHTDASYQEFENRDHGTIVGKMPEANDPVGKVMLDFISGHKTTSVK